MNKDIFRVSALALGILAAPSIIGINNAKAAEIAITGDGRVDCTTKRPAPALLSEQILPDTNIKIGTEPNTLTLSNEGGGVISVYKSAKTGVKLFDLGGRRSGEEPIAAGTVRVNDIQFSDGKYTYGIDASPVKGAEDGKAPVKLIFKIGCSAKHLGDKK